jgi:hypothetical protein
MMPKTCSICTLSTEMRDALDHALATHVGSIRKISQEFGVSYDALYRHAQEHLPQALLASAGADAISHADDLLDDIAWQRREARGLLDAAKRTNDIRAGVAALGMLLRQLELLAKLRGELQAGQQVNILLSAEGQQLIAVILTALAPWPEARLSVADALSALEPKAAP